MVERVLGLMFKKLKALSMLALISIWAFSPSTRILGKPNDLAIFRSISRYSGTAKGVANESRRRDEVICGLSGKVGNRILIVRDHEVVVGELIIVRTCIGSSGVGKIVSCFEGVVAGAIASSSKVVGTQVLESVVAGIAIDLMWRVIDRSPPIAGVNAEYAAERPSTDDLLYPAMAAVKENRLPDAKDLERLIDVEVRPPIGVAGVVKVRVAKIRAGVGIHAVAPGILRLRGEGVRELMLESGEQHIVVGFALAAEGVNAIY